MVNDHASNGAGAEIGACNAAGAGIYLYYKGGQYMATKEAQARATAKYDAANTKKVVLKLNLNTDADILAKLESVGNKQGYIKALIRADL